MGVRDKSLLLLIVFSFSLFPIPVVSVQASNPRTLDQALSLMYLSEAVMLPDEEIDDSAASLGFHTTARMAFQRSLADPLLARIIHAKKQQRNNLDTAYRLLSAQLKSEGKDCEADRIKSTWEKRRAEINAQIGFYHRVRGDRRKAFTRLWHSLKRAGRGFWQRIGPLGRNILRRVGPEVLQVVASGGTLSGGLLRRLVKQHFKKVVQERVQKVVYQGVERLLRGQLSLARAAGVDLCGEEEQPSSEAADPSAEDEQQDTSDQDLNQVLGVYDILEGGYASLKWEKFLFIEAAPGYSPAQGETRNVTYDLNLDINAGTFSGSAWGQLSGKEVTHQELGEFTVTGIQGMIVEDQESSVYLLEGRGDLSASISMTEGYSDGINQYQYQRTDSFQSPILITGKLVLWNTTWELDLTGTMDNGTQSFSLSCRDCVVGTWEP